MTDPLKWVISVVGANVSDGVWVADRMPRPDELDANLPAVSIDLLPSSESTAWGGFSGPVMEGIALDIDVVAPSRADAVPVADKVREILHALPHIEGSAVSSVECPRFATRPDISPYVRRIGVESTIMTRSERD